MPLNSNARAVVDELMSKDLPAICESTAVEARRNASEATKNFRSRPDPAVKRRDWELPGGEGSIRGRLYFPPSGPSDGLLVYYHGGGWVLGELDSYDANCCRLALTTGLVVASIDYRLAPETPYPGAAEDCYAATAYLAGQRKELGIESPTPKLAVAGDSAGGNLATVVCLMAKDRGGPAITHQTMIYPVTDHDFDTPSYREFATDHVLTRADMIWFWDQYVPERSRRNEDYVAPLRRADLSGLPPALVVTAECDPLRDEGERYAARLAEAGVPTKLLRVNGLPHAFFGWPEKFPEESGQVIRLMGEEIARI
ncbi:Carboxylesterase NlhH [Planctomycetes bacterium Pan216]|uniref:Carboxylesterase NlhH n=1 Tax=Kolteria novifilia TaxID=2527975 RepID=A0A518BBW1_9BACT|nr:Carboxylesterase NlhH [Planctomycetes bacterium Pan216]